MSELTDTVNAPATVTPAPVSCPRVPAAELVRLTQGLYFIFWGLLVTVLVAAQMVLVQWGRTYSGVFLSGGVIATLAGTWRLHQVRLATLPVDGAAKLWRRRASWLWWTALLLVYFAVLFHLWRRVPDSFYLQLNAAAFVATGIAFLTLLNRAVTALAAVVGQEEMVLESRLFTAANVVLLIVPYAAGLGYVVWMAARNQTTLTEQLQQLVERMSFPVTSMTLLALSIVVLLPFSLTLSLVWAAKDITVRELVARDGRRDGGDA